jgi:hypothetical protein
MRYANIKDVMVNTTTNAGLILNARDCDIVKSCGDKSPFNALGRYDNKPKDTKYKNKILMDKYLDNLVGCNTL